jgi:glucosamine kinase
MTQIFRHVLAIDGGGTSCRGALVDLASGARWDAVEGPSNISDFEAAAARVSALVAQLFEAAGPGAAMASTAAHVGLAGVIGPSDSDGVSARLPFGRIRVTSDQPTMIVGALGGRDGAVAAVGTGSFVGIQAGGAVRVIGGWGLAIGDQASGAWLGRGLLTHALLVGDGIAPSSPLAEQMLKVHGGVVGVTRFSLTARPADYGRLAPGVVSAAASGDALAIGLMREGADYITAALAALGWRPGQRLCLAGGLGPAYANWLPPEIAEGLAAPDGTALDGALILARRLAEADT